MRFVTILLTYITLLFISLTKGEEVYRYLGCFYDRLSGRALPIARLVVDGLMSRDTCGSLCRGYRYFGLQNGNQCYCGNIGYGRYGLARDGCGARCSGNSGEICGGDQRNSVFEIVYPITTPTTSTTSTMLPTSIGTRVSAGFVSGKTEANNMSTRIGETTVKHDVANGRTTENATNGDLKALIYILAAGLSLLVLVAITITAIVIIKRRRMNLAQVTRTSDELHPTTNSNEDRVVVAPGCESTAAGKESQVHAKLEKEDNFKQAIYYNVEYYNLPAHERHDSQYYEIIP